MENITLDNTKLDLVTTKINLGELVTNAQEIHDMVKNAMPKYNSDNYNDENIKQAIDDKAALNKAAKSLNQKRLDIQREFNKPFEVFKGIIDETIGYIKICSSNIDEVVKQNEQQYKDKKNKSIEEYYNSKDSFGVELSKIFKSQWLNKTVKEKAVFKEIDEILNQIASDLQVLEGYPEDTDVLKTLYLGNLNINDTLNYANRLKEQRDLRAKAEEEKKNSNKETVEVHTTSPEPLENEKEIPSDDVEISFVNPVEEEIYIRAFKVTTTRDNIIALGDFMKKNGINFKKIELND